MDLSALGVGTVKGSCEYCNEPPGSLKCWKVLEYVDNW
jgi:hypothetical protein